MRTLVGRGGMATAGRGAFILLEGVDRAGKTTQARMLVQHLQVRLSPRAPGRRCGRPGSPPLPGGRERRRGAGLVRRRGGREAGDRRGGDRVQRHAGLRGVRPATNARHGGWHGGGEGEEEEEVPSVRRLQEGARPGGRDARGSAPDPHSDPN